MDRQQEIDKVYALIEKYNLKREDVNIQPGCNCARADYRDMWAIFSNLQDYVQSEPDLGHAYKAIADLDEHNHKHGIEGVFYSISANPFYGIRI